MALALVFPGQGSQYPGMDAGLSEVFPQVTELFQQADEVLGYQLSKLMKEGPERDLILTPNAQPALLTVSTALFRLLNFGNHSIIGVAGHSLGEYSALVAAGVLKYEDALKAVQIGRAHV